MTEKLYDYNAYDTEFEAKVIECIKENELYAIVLDRTLFFPEEGGQSCDKGYLNGENVIRVKIKDNIIYHYIKAQLEVGSSVKGKIDFSHRFSNMQMHSGEHIFTGLVHSTYGYNNVGFHLSDNSATMDYDGKLSAEEIFELEKRANEIIFSNRMISAYYPSREELNALDYRSKKEINGDVRIVVIDGVDTCACCAPHVLRTGEIGLFKVVSFENYKGGVRIHYLCGFRALNHYDNRINELRAISNLLTVKENTEAESVFKLYEENKKNKFELVSLRNKLLEKRIYESCDSSKGYAVFIGDSEDISSLKYAMEALHRISKGVCAAFAGDEINGYRYLIEQTGGDVSSINRKLKDNYMAKGGGRPDSIQGSVFIDKKDIELLFSDL